MDKVSKPDRVLHLSGFYLDLTTDWCKCGLKRQTKRTEQQKGNNKETIRKRAR